MVTHTVYTTSSCDPWLTLVRRQTSDVNLTPPDGLTSDVTTNLMEYMRAEYDNLHARIHTSETRINQELRDKSEQQAREVSTMDDT